MSAIRSAFLCLVMLLSGLAGTPASHGAAASSAQETDSSAPFVVVESDGADIALIGSATIERHASGGAYLTLDRITIAGDATIEMSAAAEPELIVMVRGEILEQDERGFWTRIEAPRQVALGAGATVRWQAARDTTLLRLRLTGAPPEERAPAGSEIERVARFRLDAPPTGPVRMFIAEASFSRSGSARIEHADPVGIAVVGGALDLVSPSGLEGTLGAGQSALYPAEAAIVVTGTSEDADAQALLVGVTSLGD